LWSSRDLALVIVLAIIGLFYGVFVYQIGRLLTGIPGINYLLTIGLDIWFTVSFLLFKGKRWRFFLTVLIFVLLTIPTHVMGPPYDIISRIPGILTPLFIDIIFNSFYNPFNRRNSLLKLCMMLTVTFVTTDIALRVIVYPFLFSPEYVAVFYEVTLMLLPIVIIEAIAGAFIGFKIFQRIKVSSLIENV
jgi:hypothetical protein